MTGSDRCACGRPTGDNIEPYFLGRDGLIDSEGRKYRVVLDKPYREYSTPEEMLDDICEPEQPYQLPEWLSVHASGALRPAGGPVSYLSREEDSWGVEGSFTPQELRELADAIEHYQRADQ